MYRILAVVAVFTAVSALSDEDIESLVASVFGPNATSETTAATVASTSGSTPGVSTTSDKEIEALIASVFGPNATTEKTAATVASTSGSTPGVSSTSTTVTPGPSTQTSSPIKCYTQNNEEGVCTLYYLCEEGDSPITDDGIDLAFAPDTPCESYLEICCRQPVKKLGNKTVTPFSNNDAKHREGCGWRNPQGVGFLLAGDSDTQAKYGEFPWVVAIFATDPANETDAKNKKEPIYLGGGSLIHKNIVLTAAHLVAQDKPLRVRAGEWDTQTTGELYPHQDRDVVKVEIHKDFNKGNLFYDIALLFLETPMELTPNVGVVCLPPPRERVAGGTRCFASGWGKDKFGKEGIYQVILKKIELPVMEKNECQEALRKTRLGKLFQLHSSFMCAGGESGSDTCTGDGGSPLVCPVEFEKDRYMQSGIVSWGINCGHDSTPAAYVDVSNLREWIDDKVKGQGYQIDGYSYTF